MTWYGVASLKNKLTKKKKIYYIEYVVIDW